MQGKPGYKESDPELTSFDERLMFTNCVLPICLRLFFSLLQIVYFIIFALKKI